MRCVVVPVLFGMGLGAMPARAQVINGEGTYEGSSMHQPPAPQPDQSGKPDGAGKADATSRDRVDPATRIDRD